MYFAHELNRTLVLPNFIEYHYPNTVIRPFETIFEVSEMLKYQKVIKMMEFAKEIMNTIWPEENRTAFCWSPRKSAYNKSAPTGCHAKEGNPSVPYWDNIGVSFHKDAYFGDLLGGYDLTTPGLKAAWLQRFPPSDFPVLAFPSPPAPFPSRASTWSLQRYLKWNSIIADRANQFVENELLSPFVAVHLRNDRDWDQVCELLSSHSSHGPLFASMQCDGEANYNGVLTQEICSPSKKTIVEQVTEVVRKIGASSVFVSSDRDHMIKDFNKALQTYKVKIHRLIPDDPLLSLAIFAKADHFIGNCISTFSHFARRERDSEEPRKPTSYFGIRHRSKLSEL
ncbi:hypothetical protein DICVIV_07104 [Dictyocaulus viviparus]|uniref:GDP-fucose protein O-fucosyltransferase 1 n=1 Tax=Dictyocaulus viviparus TaxID=29172 RepID=A0A0D8XSV2_DICVI|nr:hypothetical protein DICVIV_07104 [Dictyocaulus viviparus]